MNEPRAGIGCIVLAAGSGNRFGSDKRIARFGSSTLLEQTLGQLAPAFTQRILVLRPGDEALGERFSADWRIVLAPDANQGMGHSLAAAMAWTADWDGAVIALGDMPFVQGSTCQALSAALTPDGIVVPHYKGQRGNPVGIGRRYFSELARLQGDQGARMLLQQHAAAVSWLEVEDPGVLRDIDTPAALDAPEQGD